MVLWISFRTSEDSQDRVTHEFVDRSVMRKNHRHQDTQILIEHFDDIIRVHFTGQLRKTPDIRVKNGDFAAPATEPQSTAMSQQLIGDFGGKLTE